LGLLQRDVASRLKVNETTIFNWENNRTTPALRHIPTIVDFLGYISCDLPDSLGERFLVCRKIRGFSRKRMAKTLGVNESTLARWETGRNRPTRKSLEILKAFLMYL